MAPPYTIPENVTNFVDLFDFANYAISPTGYHYMGDFVVIILWVVTWAVFSLSNRERPQLKSLIIASYAAFFFSVIMDVVGLIDDVIIALTFAGLIISVVIDKILENR